MRVEVDDLNLISFCPPAPPQKLVLVGSAYDGGDFVAAISFLIDILICFLGSSGLAFLKN